MLTTKERAAIILKLVQSRSRKPENAIEAIASSIRVVERDTWLAAAEMMRKSGDWRTMSRERAERLFLDKAAGLKNQGDENG